MTTAILSIGVLLGVGALAAANAADSLPPLAGGKAPQTLDDLWAGYDPRAEPLETTVVREWRPEGITCRVVLFTVGTFKGKRSRVAAFYAFPDGAKGKLPGLLHLHGGGQRADLTMVTFLALNGYAALSLNWGGNPLEGAHAGVPNTDWGAVDATQNSHNSHYGSLAPDEKTLDAVESPRNNNWFLLVLAARRGLTFLERQPEVDPERLGVCGHSMGGKLTTDLAGIDPRVKAAVPSCGGAGSAPEKVLGTPGSGQQPVESALLLRTIDDRAYIPRVRCPILYLAPTNDFHAVLDNAAENWKGIGSREVRWAVSPHFNHRNGKEFEASEFLWFKHFLKGGPALPRTPALAVKLDGPGGVPVATLRPDRPGEVTRACVYYSTDPHALTRFWRDGRAERRGDAWVARCPVMRPDQPLYVHASVYYPLRQRFQSCRWMAFDGTTDCALSSEMLAFTPAELQRASVRAAGAPEALIDDFARGWQDWYRLEWTNPFVWEACTRKVKDPQWRGPDSARLAVDVLSSADTALVVRLRQNDWSAFPGQPGGEYAAAQAIHGSPDWQTLTFALGDFRPTNERTKAPLQSWRLLTELELCGSCEVLEGGQAVRLGGQRWPEPRRFRNLRWVDGPTQSMQGEQ